MKQKLLLVAASFIVALLLAFRHAGKQENKALLSDPPATDEKYWIRCSPDWNELQDWLEETDIPLIPGAGSHTWRISTNNDSAQFYFNQGINMYFSFHLIEAMASFKKAAKFDPGCAMLYWAQALGYGPNINDLGYRASPEALAAVQRARELEGTASPLEKELIGAMAVRYTADSADASRASLNQEYTDRMKNVYENNPAHPDVQALYADAMMLQHPWDLWTIDGSPKPWTPLIREVLEKLLAQYPEHPGGNHYYIHVMEPSPFAAKALPSADILGKTNPGLSHVVHMPSHIYLRTGHYQKGVEVNVNAVNSYNKTVPLFAPVTGNDFLYVIHNLHMKTNNAMLTGNYKTSVASALETQKSVLVDYLSIPPPMGSLVQYVHMTPVLVYVRFGKWNELLKIPAPGKTLSYALILYHFGRGMALSAQSKLPDAKRELSALQELMKDTSLAIPLTPFSPALDGAVVAENLLIGTIAIKERKLSDAIAAFEEAVVTEENMVYNEPRDWMLNPKQYLGNAFLQAGRAREAREIFEKDLQNNQENGWSLYGTWLALRKEKRNAEATKVMIRFNKAFSKADVKINAAVF